MTDFTSLIPLSQNDQSQTTQAGTVQTGADLINTMTQRRLDSLFKAQDRLNTEIMNTSKAAATPIPVSGTSAVTMPGQHQWPIIPNDTSPTYSRSATKEKGIANMIRGVANIVGAYETKEQNNKNKALSIDIERLMEANQGVQSAQQVLQQDPSNQQAKDTLKKNQDIMDSILSDPKKRKQIGKAFDISFIDPTQNNKPEHAALKQAIDSYSQQFQKKLPVQMAPNVQAQARMGQLTQMSNLINEQIKAANSDRLEGEILRYNLGQQKLALDTQKEQDVVSYRNASLAQRRDLAAAKIMSSQENAKLLASTRIQAAVISANARIESTQRLIDGRMRLAQSQGLTGGTALARVIQGNIKLRQQQVDAINQQILQAQTLYNDPKASPHDKEAAQQFINKQENLRDQYVDDNNADFEQIKSIQSLGGDLNGTGSNDIDSPNWKPPAILNPNGARPAKPAATTTPTTDTTTPSNTPTGVKTVGPSDGDSQKQFEQDLIKAIQNS